MAVILNVEPENYSPHAQAILVELGTVENGPFSRNELLARLSCQPAVEVMIVRLAHQVDAEMLASAPTLKVIVTATTGLNHIDLETARQRGITVLSLRGETEFLRSIPATAEHTWGLLLALVRHIPAAFDSVKAGAWDRDLFRGHDLSGKSLGILGLGRIGEKVAQYALAFGMRVLAFDPYREKWIEGVERCASQEALLAASEVFSIHVPLNASTEKLIGAAELARLPAGAVLINTARGEIIDEAALLEALQSGRLAGAALDVLWNERSPDLLLSPLMDYARTHSNLIITPHIGGATVESMAMTEIFMAEQLDHFSNLLNDLRKKNPPCSYPG